VLNEWFVKMREVVHGKVKFVDDRSLSVEGSGRIMRRSSDGKKEIIE